MSANADWLRKPHSDLVRETVRAQSGRDPEPLAGTAARELAPAPMLPPLTDADRAELDRRRAFNSPTKPWHRDQAVVVRTEPRISKEAFAQGVKIATEVCAAAKMPLAATEQKTITIKVPFHDDPIRRADGALWDGRDRTGAAKDGRSIAVLHADIGKALLATWPGEPEDLSDGAAAIGEDRPCFTGSEEATIAKLAEVDPVLAADVARANGVECDWEERVMRTLDLGDLEAADKARDATRIVYCTRCCKDHAVMPDETPCPDGTWIAKAIG